MNTITSINPEEVCFEINELALHGLTVGGQDEPITLCLHGWLDNAASFLPLMPYLPDRRIIAIDWPGHGKHPFAGLGAEWLGPLRSAVSMARAFLYQSVSTVSSRVKSGHEVAGQKRPVFGLLFIGRYIVSCGFSSLSRFAGLAAFGFSGCGFGRF